MSDFLKTCLWICGDEKIASPLFRKAFSANKDIESAVLFCTGLGYFESYVNGMRIGDDVLVPAQTDYDYRTRITSYNVCYTKLLRDDFKYL